MERIFLLIDRQFDFKLQSVTVRANTLSAFLKYRDAPPGWIVGGTIDRKKGWGISRAYEPEGRHWTLESGEGS